MKSAAKKAMRALWGRGANRIPDALDDRIRVVSFDVFDTLVVRSCGAPEKVFELVGATAVADGLVGDGKAFAEARIRAEREARASAGANNEITLAEIYDRLRNAYGENTDELMQLELACELAVCEQNPAVAMQMQEIAKTRNVVITSDTYLPKWFMEVLLEECDIAGYDRLYVSSEHRVMKRDGRLFSLLLDDMAIGPGHMLHIGDHPLADWVTPKKMGVKAELYRRSSPQGLSLSGDVRDLERLLKESILRTAPHIKRSRVVRMLTWPAMTTRYALGDLKYSSSDDSRKIASLKDAYKGERCFIVGNGPSLLPSDLDAIAHETTFGSNGVWKLFGKTKWRPTFYLAVDRDYLAAQSRKLAEVIAGTIMVHRTVATVGNLRGRPNVVFLNAHARRYTIDYSSCNRVAFSNRPDRVVYPGFTVTYVALQLAMWMGFSDIYLIGMDHTYSSRIESGGKVIAVNGVRNHAFDDENKAVVNAWNARGVEHAYMLARKAAEERGVHIYNATRGGALEVFERANLDELLASTSIDR